MSITRRTLVRNLTTLSALPLVSGLDSPALAAMLRGSAATCASPTPTPNSIFVLFQGPWIIDQPDPSASTLRATTIGRLDALWPAIHHCPVGLGNICSSSLGNFSDGNSMALPLELGLGELWSIVPSGSYTPPSTSITTLFDSPYNAKDPFVYIKDSNMTVTPHSHDRTVTLPIPDAAYVGGFLGKCKVSGDTIAVQSGGTQPAYNNPYAVHIFEYQTKSGTPPALTLNPEGRAPINLSGSTPNTHLVFRMIHSDQMTTRQHVRAAHDSLRRRIRNSAGDGAMLDLKLAFDPGEITATQGSNTAYFDPLEMGLTPVLGHAGTTGNESGRTSSHVIVGTSYGDCCGGGMVLGG
jgi:hypothetical protein